MTTIGKPEGIIENYLEKKSKENGFLCYKFISYGVRGVPDRILIGHGKTIFVECKAPEGRLRRQQEIRIQQMREHGAQVEILYTRQQIDQFFESEVKQYDKARQNTKPQ